MQLDFFQIFRVGRAMAVFVKNKCFSKLEVEVPEVFVFSLQQLSNYSKTKVIVIILFVSLMRSAADNTKPPEEYHSHHLLGEVILKFCIID